ncbi:MAG: ABC transporter permease [Candidatus Humimicrobiaceae bacterium]
METYKINLSEKRESASIKNWLIGQVINNRLFILSILTVVLLILMLIFRKDSFFTYQNWGAILLNLSTAGVLSIGMMLLIVGGVFDLSIGANLALGGAVAAYFLKNFTNLPILLAAVIGISLSAIVGLVNGIVINKLKVNALIATLGMMSICRSIAIIITGSGIAGLPEAFLAFGRNTYFGLQLPVYYVIGATVIGFFVLKKTKFFRQLYYIGSNEKAALLSGINVERTMIIIFVIMGVLAGFAGLMISSRLNAAVGTVAESINLQVIAGVVLGGGSLTGGRGSILGAFAGALFMSLISNVMVLSSFSIYLQTGIIGFILITALSLDVTISRKYGVQV